MTPSKSQSWLHRFAVLTALATLGLVVLGGLVTSHGVGMAVPDWPTSYGYNMFALPVSTWLTGGVFHEHTHRLWASAVGVLVVALTRGLGGRKACFPLLLTGVAEIAAGLVLLKLGADWRGTGHFLSGIGGVVLLGGMVWVKNAPASKPLPLLGWVAFVLVQLQGLLGGLRVVLDAQLVADVRLGTAFGIVHGCLGQAFLVLLCVIALFTSGWWRERSKVQQGTSPMEAVTGRLFLAATILIFLQLMMGATMRHQHAGLAIPDFPLAYGKLWPDTSAEAVAGYNQQRVEITAANAITSFQIWLQMLHRIMAVGILVAVAAVVWATRRFDAAVSLRRLAMAWLGLILVQVALGAWTIWSNKAADVATAHVLVGALSLVTGVFGCIICFRFIGAAQAQSVSKSTGTYAPGAPVTANP
ncbi:MAG TPA: COX15/CtaA family protein [Verrucomicrobiae bacterium]|nr:COX15/CtaA family protein [Verrucomicrobiae bacterium]